MSSDSEETWSKLSEADKRAVLAAMSSNAATVGVRLNGTVTVSGAGGELVVPDAGD